MQGRRSYFYTENVRTQNLGFLHVRFPIISKLGNAGVLVVNFKFSSEQKKTVKHHFGKTIQESFAHAEAQLVDHWTVAALQSLHKNGIIIPSIY